MVMRISQPNARVSSVNGTPTRQYSRKLELRRIDERARLFFDRFVTDRYGTSEQDRKELDE